MGLPEIYAAASRLSLTSSVIVVVVFATILPAVAACLALAGAVRMYLRARRAREDFAARAPLARGHAALVGTVDADTDGPAVRVRVHQFPQAIQPHGRSSFRWTEVDRDVEAHPFDLVLDSGERVRVRATDAVRICDALGPPVAGRTEPERMRAATIEPGARVHAVGVLSRERDVTGAAAGYRGGGASWVLAGSRRERLILSKKPFDALFRAKARFSLKVALAIALPFALLQVHLADFNRLNRRGVVLPARELTVSTFQTSGKSAMIHYQVSGVVTVDGRRIPVTDETSYDVYADVARRSDRTLVSVPFVVDPRATPPIAQIGEPGISTFQTITVFVALAVGAALFWMARRRSRPWWEREQVVDVDLNS